MHNEELTELYLRDLRQLSIELEAFTDEDQLWVLQGEIKNAPGNLIMHLVGNLQHYIGAKLGGTNYQRDRENEFSGKMTRDQLKKEIEATAKVIQEVLPKVSVDQWNAHFNEAPPHFNMTTSQFVLHLYGHLSWHLGQINYHRRILFS